MTQTQPQYNQQPDCIFTQTISNQTYKVNIFFNQNTTETFDDKLMQVLLLEQPTTKR